MNKRIDRLCQLNSYLNSYLPISLSVNAQTVPLGCSSKWIIWTLCVNKIDIFVITNISKTVLVWTDMTFFYGHFVHIFMVPRGWTVMTLVSPWLFSPAPSSGQSFTSNTSGFHLDTHRTIDIQIPLHSTKLENIIFWNSPFKLPHIQFGTLGGFLVLEQ